MTVSYCFSYCFQLLFSVSYCFPRTEQEKVFQRFYRLSKDRANQGSGLGLSLVAAVCRQHKAKIDLSNNSGLVVKIEIPIEN